MQEDEEEEEEEEEEEKKSVSGKDIVILSTTHKTHKCILLASSQFVNVKSGVYELQQRFSGVTGNKTGFHVAASTSL